MAAPEPTAAEWAERTTAAWEAELVRRYQAGLPLSKIDKTEARKIIAKAKSAP